ncbi:hypothetical protein MLD38_010963 [Melastoma candidum]|uniref:Uncharacterized protein n=1 Tax=Melastoma candidum TaxID=119954 RepID=A0ACB9R236_9MYRT|nr:hypothetical protein MLD38_010963 [Melastoma candidum]
MVASSFACLDSSWRGHGIGAVDGEERIGGCLADLWREIQGCNNWEGLLEPSLHPLLQREAVRYGRFVAACYDAFDLDPGSKHFLRCKYGKKVMFSRVGLEDCGYEVTKYVYATAPRVQLPIQGAGQVPRERWVGYVAEVTSDRDSEILGRRDLLVVFRGAVTHHEWMSSLMMNSLTVTNLDPHDARPEVKVESGFLGMYTSPECNDRFGIGSCRDQLLSEVSRLLKKYKDEEVSITLVGHSMGSSLALLLAYDIAELRMNAIHHANNQRKNNQEDALIPITVFSFGGPRVGNGGFKDRCEELGIKVLRIVNPNDLITRLPGVFFNEGFRPWSNGSCYAHLGVELTLESINMRSPSCAHDINNYISILNNQAECNPWRVENMKWGVDLSRINLHVETEELVQYAHNFRDFLWRGLQKGNCEFSGETRE